MADVRLCALAAGVLLAAGWSPTHATPLCPGDADGSGFVDFDDLNLLLTNWNTSVPPGTMGDEDGDGDVDFDDLDVDAQVFYDRQDSAAATGTYIGVELHDLGFFHRLNRMRQ